MPHEELLDSECKLSSSGECLASFCLEGGQEMGSVSMMPAVYLAPTLHRSKELAGPRRKHRTDFDGMLTVLCEERTGGAYTRQGRVSV